MMNIRNVMVALCAIGSIFTSNLLAQETTNSNQPSKHEVSIIADDIFAKNVTYYYSGYTNNIMSLSQGMTNSSTTPSVGLGYKLNFSNSALRTKLSVIYLSNKVTNSTINDPSTSQYQTAYNNPEDKLNALGFKAALGYERHKNFDKVQLFYGADIVASFSNYTENSGGNNSYYDQTTGEYNNLPYTSKRTGNFLSYGISPLIGVKYFLTPHLSISSEIHYSASMYTNKSKETRTNSNYENNSTETGLMTSFGPLGNISLNIRF